MFIPGGIRTIYFLLEYNLECFLLSLYLPTISKIHTQSQMLIIQFNFHSQIKDFYLVRTNNY